MNKEYAIIDNNKILVSSDKGLREEPYFKKSNELLTQENIVENIEGKLEELNNELERNDLKWFFRIKGHYFPIYILIAAPLSSLFSNFIFNDLLTNKAVIIYQCVFLFPIYTLLEIYEYVQYRQRIKLRKEISFEIEIIKKKLSYELEKLSELRNMRDLYIEEPTIKINKVSEENYDESLNEYIENYKNSDLERRNNLGKSRKLVLRKK